MKILIATTNPGKIKDTKMVFGKLGHEGFSFADLKLDLVEPEETKISAEDIAREKAIEYAKQFKRMPVLARDDTVQLDGVDEEDDPKNHNKEFVAQKMGEYSDENGEKVFSDIAKKYGGEVPFTFTWGFALAWWDGDEIKVASEAMVLPAKLVSAPSPIKEPGFCFGSVCKVNVNGEWKYDSELTEEEYFVAYLDRKGELISRLIKEMLNSR